MTDKKKSVWEPILPIPDDAPAARIRHSERGEPLRVFVYHDEDKRQLGYVCRFLTSSGDALHLPLTWCRDQEGIRAWRWIQFPRLRPLFGLDTLAEADEQDNVLIVFDEHAASEARRLVPWLKAVSWPGGVRKIDEVDWSPLRNRVVWIWPTLTRHRAKQRRDIEGDGQVLPRDKQPNWQAALKLEKIITGYGGVVVSIVDPWRDDSRPEGWDAGMAGTQDWTPEQASAWMEAHLGEGLGNEFRQRIRKLKGEGDQPPAQPSNPASTPSGAGAGSGKGDSWIPDLIYKSGELSACLSNVFQILDNREDWKGVVALDEFSLKITKCKPPPFAHGTIGEWSETDDARTAMLLQRQYGFTPSSALVREAISVVADSNRVHPVREYLRSLTWDGIPRLESWLHELVGAPDTPYTRRVGKWWLMGAVMRALNPGCKFDYTLVLAGKQGKKKSSILAALGGDWFSDADLDFANKDAMLALQGKLIYEIAELGALARTDERRQKSFLSRRFDEFRPPYGRGFVKVPRQMVFAGSTNEWEWNKDPTGGRRFWPIDCGTIRVDLAIANRDQYFAEALHYVEAGERCWPEENEQAELFDPEQLKIEQQDAFFDALWEWVHRQAEPFSLVDAAVGGLDMKDLTKLTRDVQTRVGQALRKIGCTKHERKSGKGRFLYKPPEEEAKSPTTPPDERSEQEREPCF